jgi:hypothetical protein
MITEPEGDFAIPNMPLASCVVRAFHPDCGGIPAHTFLPQMPGTGAVVLEVPAPATDLGALALLARTRGQQAVGGTEFVLLADEAGLGTRVRGDKTGAAPALAFPAGSYSVWATAPGRQTRALVTVHPTVEPVRPESIWFVETASLRLRAPRGHDIVVSLVAREVVFRVEGQAEGGSVAGEGDAVHEQEWSLLPGDYVIDSPTGRRRVELRAGEPQVLDLTRPPDAPR